jgi:hypothetical protein
MATGAVGLNLVRRQNYCRSNASPTSQRAHSHNPLCPILAFVAFLAFHTAQTRLSDGAWIRLATDPILSRAF